MIIKACLFDMDGVIVDTARFHFRAWHRLADSLGIEFSEEQNEQLKGVSRVDSLEKILAWGHLQLNNAKKIELMELKNKWYLDFVAEVSPSDMLPGVFPFLQELKSRQIAIGLGSSSKNSILILEKLGILDFFATIVDGNKIHMSKPHPEVFLRGALELGLQPSEIVVFEDAISGVDAAISGGFKCIGVGDQKFLSHATAVVNSLENMTVDRMISLVEL